MGEQRNIEVVGPHSAVAALEQAMQTVGLPEPEMPLQHIFAPGVYVRQLTIPAGVLLTGKIHKTSHVIIMVSGRAVVWSSTHPESREVVAPYVGITEPGTQRVIYGLEDSVWLTIHANPEDTQDLEALESRLIASQESALLHERMTALLAAEPPQQMADTASLEPQYDYMGAP